MEIRVYQPSRINLKEENTEWGTFSLPFAIRHGWKPTPTMEGNFHWNHQGTEQFILLSGGSWPQSLFGDDPC